MDHPNLQTNTNKVPQNGKVNKDQGENVFVLIL